MPAIDGSVIVRRLTPRDAAAYRTLMLDAYTRDAEAFTSTAGERQGQPLQWWAERIASDDGTSVAFGAFDDTARSDTTRSDSGALIGSAGLEFETRDKTRHKSLLFGMFVQPEHRGRGIGRALIEAAIAHARARPGSVVMNLALTGGNDAALKLYQSCGFETYGIEPMGLRIDGGYRGKVLMWRRVDEVAHVA